MRFLFLTGLFASLAAFGVTILPVTNPGFNGAITGSALTATTVASQLAEVNGIQGVKLYLQSPTGGVPFAGNSSALIAILTTSGLVGGTSTVAAGTTTTIAWDFQLAYDPGITLNSVSFSLNMYTPGEETSTTYLSQGAPLTSLDGHQFTGSVTTDFFNELAPGTQVDIQAVVTANYKATSGQNITLTIPNSSIDINAAVPTSVPEPSSAALVAMAGGALWLAGRRRK
jgi:hypothetical protein